MIPLLVSAHRDPTQFKDPDHFNPTNFLDAQGEFQNNDAFMPFAPGLDQEGGDPSGWHWGAGRRCSLNPHLHPYPQESGCAWVLAWPALRSSSSSLPSCKSSACSPWEVLPTSILLHSALAWAMCHQPSSSVWWPAEVGLHYSDPSGPDLLSCPNCPCKSLFREEYKCVQL